METDKDKAGTVNQLAVRIGGLVITLPFSIFLSVILFMIAIGSTILIFFGTAPVGIPSNLMPIMISIDMLCIIALFVLVRATLRYGGGMRALFKRLRGIHKEQARIERLMQSDGGQDNSDESLLYSDANDLQQQKKQ